MCDWWRDHGPVLSRPVSATRLPGVIALKLGLGTVCLSVFCCSGATRDSIEAIDGKVRLQVIDVPLGAVETPG